MHKPYFSGLFQGTGFGMAVMGAIYNSPYTLAPISIALIVVGLIIAIVSA